jgi:hypothetical protein
MSNIGFDRDAGILAAARAGQPGRYVKTRKERMNEAIYRHMRLLWA